MNFFNFFYPKMEIYIIDSRNHRDDTNYEHPNRLINCYNEMIYNNIPFTLHSASKTFIDNNPLDFDFDDCVFRCPLCNKKCTFCKNDDCPGIYRIDFDTFVTPFTEKCIYDSISCIYTSINDICSNKIKYGYCLIRPPGHHAAEKPTGFCIVNNSIIAANYLITKGYKKICILDWDYHHPDGTYNLMKDNKNIFLVSIHAYGKNIYPGTGSIDENSDNVLNIPINCKKRKNKEINNEFYLNCMKDLVIPFIESNNIDFIVISNGVDAHKDDSICGFNIDEIFYYNATKELKKLNLPMLFILEGGYTPKVVTDVTFSIRKALIES